jgi:hypothetical protein
VTTGNNKIMQCLSGSVAPEFSTDMLMRLLISFTKGIMMAIGITLPKPEQEKTVAFVWVVALFVMIGIIAGVGWLVLTSFSNSAR